MAKTKRGQAPFLPKIAIVCDGILWHVRRLRVIEHDWTADEKVYRCDRPIANDLPSLSAAVRAVRRLSAPRRGRK